MDYYYSALIYSLLQLYLAVDQLHWGYHIMLPLYIDMLFYGNLHECRTHLHIIESSLCRLVLVHWMNGILYVIMGSTVDLIHWATIPGVGY